jgi:hypothetical protein
VIELVGQARYCKLSALDLLHLAGLYAAPPRQPRQDAGYHLQRLPQIVSGHRKQGSAKLSIALQGPIASAARDYLIIHIHRRY